MHKHAFSMFLYAQDAMMTEKPWIYWIYKPKGFENWVQCEAHPRWTIDWQYKRKSNDEMVR